MTIGNLSSKIRRMPSTDCAVMVTLLPIPIQNGVSPQKRLDEQQGSQIALSIATYIMPSGISVLCASVERMNLEIMSLLITNTPGGITTYIKRSAMPTPRQPIPNSLGARFTADSMCLDIIPASWATSLSPTFSIQCRSACLTTSIWGFSTSWKLTNGWTSTMQSGCPCLLTKTSHKKISRRKKFLNGMERRWRKWAGTWLEL